MNLEGSKLGLQTRLAEQESNISNLKQTLLRTTLAKQSLESEKKELMRKIEDINENSNNDDVRRVEKAVYNEELQVARDAIANLRSSFSDSDPNQHILDTLEQCISVIVEKLVDGSKPGSRMSNSEHSDIGEKFGRPTRNTFLHLSSFQVHQPLSPKLCTSHHVQSRPSCRPYLKRWEKLV